MEVVGYAPRFEEEWDACVRSARNGHFMFTRKFLSYHDLAPGRFEDASLVARHKGVVVAVFPANREGETLVSYRGLPFGGLVMAPRVRFEHVAAFYGAAVPLWKKAGIRALEVTPLPEDYCMSPSAEEPGYLLARGAALARTQITATVRAGGATLANASKRRYARSLEPWGNSTFFFGAPVAEAFGFITEWTRRRHGRDPVHSQEEMRYLSGRFPGEVVAATVADGGRVLAASIVFEGPTTVRSQYQIASDEGRTSHAGDHMQMKLIQRAHSAGKTFDLGTSTNPEDGTLDTLLHRYKESLGGRAALRHTYRWTLP